MTDLFNAIKERLEPLVARGIIRDVDKWNSENRQDNKKKTTSKVSDIVFIEFIIDDVNNIGWGIKDLFLTVRLHFPQVDYKKDKEQLFDVFNQINGRMQGFGSVANAVPTFSTMKEVGRSYDYDHDALSFPFIDYETTYKDYSGYFFTNSRSIESGDVLLSYQGTEIVETLEDEPVFDGQPPVGVGTRIEAYLMLQTQFDSLTDEQKEGRYFLILDEGE